MKIGQAFPSKYLKASDLGTKRHKVKISKVELADVSGDVEVPEEKPILFFEGKGKGLVLNRTNAGTIEEAYGDETDAWAGKEIEIFATTTDFKGKRVPCIRIDVPKSAATAKESDEFSDEIPF